MKIIFFNSPPQSGKDTCVNRLVSKYNVHPFSFKTHLVAITKMMYNVDSSEWDVRYNSGCKDKKWDKLGNITQREALINVSENILKPAFGKDYFGRIELQKLLSLPKDTITACSDAGFDEEIIPFVRCFGEKDIHIVYIRRKGYTFEGDSRTYLTNAIIPIKNYHMIYNNNTKEAMYSILDRLYEGIAK